MKLCVLLAVSSLLAACAAAPPTRPTAWSAPEVLVAPSPFKGVHGLAVDAQGRLLAGSVIGNSLWEVDRTTGVARVLVGPPEGQADDIAIGPRGELAWTSYLQGVLRYRERDDAPIKTLATGLPGINSLAFDPRSGRLYATQVFLADALWEIDLAGGAPRLIAKDLGGLNGFEIGPDGLIYGPLWFGHRVVRVDPATGAATTISDQFKTPAAANLDGRGNLWVIDTATGELSRVALATGAKTVVQTLDTSLDNLAVAPDGTVYVSNMADNSVVAYDPASGALRTLVSGELAVPAGLKLDGGTLWVADLFTLRAVDVATGAVRDVFRMHASQMEYPFAVGLSATHLALASWFTGSVQLVDRATLKTTAMLHGLKAPVDAVPLPDGSVVFAEMGSGQLIQASGPDLAQRRVIAELTAPVQMIRGADGALYVTEAAGRLLRVALDGTTSVLAGNLALPEGLAQTPWGSFVVAEAAARRLVEVNPVGGALRVIATDLPIGFEPGPGLPPTYIPTGVAVAADGTVYFSADRNNAIYRVRPL